MSAKLYLFDDRRARRWAPFSLTSPIGELLFGALTLRARAERVWGVPCSGHLSRKALGPLDEPGTPPVVAAEALPTDDVLVLISSRAVLEQPVSIPDTPARITVDGVTVGWVVHPGAARPSDLWLRDPASAPHELEELAVEGALLDYPWSLVERNADRVAADIDALWPEASDAPGVIRVGSGRLSMAEDAEVEPGVVLDTRGGPIRLEAGVRVEGPARLTGPLFVGEHTTILGGPVGRATIGAHCKVRGEVSDTILMGYVNKAHEGHLGHAVLGRWVNIGAGTNNSDLKNNYGTVTVWTPEGDIDTGLTKVGCFLGDHVKTGIGTQLNTGTVVGAGSNLFGGAMPPVAVPPFSWGAGAALSTHRLEAFLRTTERVMARRDAVLTPGARAVLSRAWEITAPQRAD